MTGWWYTAWVSQGYRRFRTLSHMKERWEKTLLCRIGNIENARALYGAPCRLSIYLCNLATQNFISLFIYLPCCNRLQCRNWKLKPWRAREQYSKGKIGFFCCMIGKVHLGGMGGGWQSLFDEHRGMFWGNLWVLLWSPTHCPCSVHIGLRFILFHRLF